MQQQTPARTQRGKSPAGRGFTLIELLTVLAIIGILAAILIPTVTGSSASAKRAKTRVQFSQWATAIEGFRQEYGYYPDFTTAAGNPGGTHFPDGKIDDQLKSQRFVEALSGRQLDGDRLVSTDPGYIAGNRKGITFLPFGAGDLNSSNQLSDAFGNTTIVVLMDKDQNGFVKVGAGGDYSGSAPSIGSLSPDLPSDGVRAGVIFYSAGDGNQLLKSWE